MYNRYQGNTGKYIRLPDVSDSRSRSEKAAAAPIPEEQPSAGDSDNKSRAAADMKAKVPAHTRHVNRPGEAGQGIEALLGGFGSAVAGRLGSLNSEDLLMLAVIYLMYRESGDRQLLLVLAALLFV